MILKAPANLYPRKILPRVTPYFDKPGVILLIGARQVGKTSILYLLMEELNRKGIPGQAVRYFDLEDLRILEIFNSGVKEVLAYLKATGIEVEKRNYLLVDEIQYLSNPSNFLKLFGDHHPNFKLIVSGSSTLDIRRKFKDSLAGRKVVFEVFPLDFYEFLLFKGEKKLAEAVSRNDARHMKAGSKDEDTSIRFFADELKRFFSEYLVFGGYPRVALEADNERKIDYLKDVYNSYVKKDIKDLMRVDNIAAFNNLLKVLALQIGNLINAAELCNTVKIARETLERYLFLLENTFIIRMVPPFSKNRRKEISKMPKLYFIDPGLRNVIISNLNPLEERVDLGSLVENGVFSNLLKNLAPLEEIHFWRTLAGNEVDFLIVKGNRIKPIEVKYSSFKSAKVPLGIRYIQKDYESEEGIVFTRDYIGRADKVTFLPVWLC